MVSQTQFIILFTITLGKVSNNMCRCKVFVSNSYYKLQTLVNMDDVQWRFSHGSKVEAKYCPIEIDGDVKYYICPRNEICCTFGCCISSNFHFYQLWYYWLMVILMFLLCSGGTWWYRYWLQESQYPPAPPPTHRPPPPHHRHPCTRVTYHPGRTTRVVVQHSWKQNRNGVVGYPTPPPSYSFVQHETLTDAVDESTASEAANTSVLVPEPKSSPYYQLYGPPPSYDSVVTETLTEQQETIHRLSDVQPHNSLDVYSGNQDSSQNTCITHSQSDEDCQENTSYLQNSNACVESQQGRILQGTHRASSTRSQSTSRSTSTRSLSRSHKNAEQRGLPK